MSKKARNWSRSQRKRIQRKTKLGPLKARRRRQDAQHSKETHRKSVRWSDFMRIAASQFGEFDHIPAPQVRDEMCKG